MSLLNVVSFTIYMYIYTYEDSHKFTLDPALLFKKTKEACRTRVRHNQVLRLREKISIL